MSASPAEGVRMIVFRKRWRFYISLDMKVSRRVGDRSSKSVASTKGTMSGAASCALSPAGTAGTSS